MITLSPLERGLKLESLTLTLFVVRGDSFRGLRRDVLDAVDVLHNLGTAEHRTARPAE